MKWLFLVAALVVPTVAMADDVPLGDDAFTSYMQHRLQQYSAAPITVTAPYRVIVNLPRGASVSFGFSDVHDACLKEPAKCERLADAFVQSAADQILSKTNAVLPEPSGAAFAKFTGPGDTAHFRIVLQIMATCRAYASVGSTMFCKVVPRNVSTAWFFRRAFANLEELCVKPMADRGYAHMTQGDRHELGLSLNEALDLCEKDTRDALGPLAGSIPPLPLDGIGTIEEPFAASRAIADDWREVAKAYGGHLLIAVPEPNTLLYMKDDGPDAIKALGARAQALFDEAAEPVCNDVYRWDGSGFVLATPESAMPRGPNIFVGGMGG